ncbi:hypothetical protein BKA93DRAFT_811882, partial [Sparassis latifolia]
MRWRAAEGSALRGRPTCTSHLVYMGIGGFCTLVPMRFDVLASRCICALHITLSPAISLVLCESCVEPPLACSTRSVFFTCLFLFAWYGASTGSILTT